MIKGTKLDTSLKYRHLAMVTTKPFHRFPIDMLRYDNAHPHEEVDALTIEDSIGHTPDSRIILVEQYSESNTPRWTVDRWASFGATIEPIDRQQVSVLRKQIEKTKKTLAQNKNYSLTK